MAKLKGPLLSLSASGTIKKLITFQERVCGSVAYRYRKPGDVKDFTPSGYQSSIRGYMTAAVSAWHALEPSEREQWEDFVED